MPRTTKAETQADVLAMAGAMFTASILLEDDLDEADLLALDAEEAELFHDDISDTLDVSALNWVAIAEFMAGDGSRGTYDQIPKSKDFFSVSLMAPDREFRHMFR